MSDPTVGTAQYPATCTKCGNNPVTLVTLGDPEAPKEVTPVDAPVGVVTIEVLTHYQFLSCEKCGESWNLPAKQAQA